MAEKCKVCGVELMGLERGVCCLHIEEHRKDNPLWAEAVQSAPDARDQL